MTMTKTATMSIEGIDTRQLEKFNEQYASAPKNFELGIECKTIWEQKGLGNLGKVGRWTLGGQAIEKPTRDFSVQLGSWKEVGDAIGVEGDSPHGHEHLGSRRRGSRRPHRADRGSAPRAVLVRHRGDRPQLRPDRR